MFYCCICLKLALRYLDRQSRIWITLELDPIHIPVVTWSKFHITTGFAFFTSKEVVLHLDTSCFSHNVNTILVLFEHYKSITMGQSFFFLIHALSVSQPHDISCNLTCKVLFDEIIKQVNYSGFYSNNSLKIKSMN